MRGCGFNFENAARLIDSGYAATMRVMPLLKQQIQIRADSTILAAKRNKIKSYSNPNGIVFNNLSISGFNRKQNKFIEKSIFYHNKAFTLEQLRKRYFRLASEDKIKSLFGFKF